MEKKNNYFIINDSFIIDKIIHEEIITCPLNYNETKNIFNELSNDDIIFIKSQRVKTSRLGFGGSNSIKKQEDIIEIYKIIDDNLNKDEDDLYYFCKHKKKNKQKIFHKYDIKEDEKLIKKYKVKSLKYFYKKVEYVGRLKEIYVQEVLNNKSDKPLYSINLNIS